MAPTTQITIAGIDATAYCLVGSTIEDSFTNEVSKATILTRFDIGDAVTLASGQTVKVWRSYSGSFLDSEIIFDGFISEFSQKDVQYTINCKDQFGKASTTIVNTIYLISGPTAGKFSEIFKDIINNYVGLTADGTSVQDSGTTHTIDKFICRNAYALERIKRMSQAINWRAYYDPATQKCNFEPVMFSANSNPINADNLANKPVWTEDQSEMANAITAIGATIQTQMEESFAGPSTQITLQKKPESVAITVGGVLKLGGQQGDPGIDYWVDKDSKQINFTASSSTIVATYFFASPVPLKQSNAASIATYGKKERVETLMDVNSITDLQARLNTLLSVYSWPFVTCKAPVKFDIDYGYKVGQQVQVSDPFTGQSATLPIQKITREIFGVKDTIQLGNKEFKLETWIAYGLDGRIKKLEEESTKDTDIIYNLIQFSHTATPSRVSIKRTVQRINDSFILGHSVNGALERGKILEEFEGGVGSWSGTDCTLASDTGTYIVGAKSMKITASASPFLITTTQSFGDLSTYTGAASGAPASGTIGLWIYAATDTDLSAAPALRIGSGIGDYSEVSALRTYTETWDLQAGWNYLLFRLKNATTSGTPDWTAVDYARVSFASAGTPVIYADYLTIGTGDQIGLNGLGDRRTILSEETTTY